MGTGSLPGVKRPGRGADHPPSHLAPRFNERVDLYLYTPPPFRLHGLFREHCLYPWPHFTCLTARVIHYLALSHALCCLHFTVLCVEAVLPHSIAGPYIMCAKLRYCPYCWRIRLSFTVPSPRRPGFSPRAVNVVLMLGKWHWSRCYSEKLFSLPK